MALLKIRTYPDPILKQIAQPVVSFDAEHQKLFDDMIETMYVEDGVGLAAPQVGVSKQIMIVSPESKRGEEYVIVNPNISDLRGREVGAEGCLSLPGLSANIARAKKLILSYQDRNGHPHEMEVRDFFARVIQHELDHLNGLLMLDRVSFSDRQVLLREYQPA